MTGLPSAQPPASAEAPKRRRKHSLAFRIVRVVFLGLLSGLALIIGLAFWMSGSVGPNPPAADVCRRVPEPILGELVEGVALETVCVDIDTRLDEPISGTDGFEGDFRYDGPPSDPAKPRPEYLVWESDGCSAPVLGRGPFDFTLACNRHDFGWRNLKDIDAPDVPTWHVDNKDRVDAGFLYDMRVRCAAVPAIFRIGCDTTARVYYTAVRLNPSGVKGIPGVDE
ncbi:MAG: hypothetical protein JW785_09755 [Acidimicrobiia bacterium]|nr:hypothetical protein [Acidimicrobiia bacterium]